MYGDLDNVCMFTLAPEIPNAMSVIEELCRRNVTVSLGKLKLLTWVYYKYKSLAFCSKLSVVTLICSKL